MGLDMYLFKRGGMNIDTNEKIQDEELGYWRKFNALHGCILELTHANPDSNCEEISLSKEDIEDILRTLKQVQSILTMARHVQLDSIDGESSTDYTFYQGVIDDVCAIFPPCSGFFWGGTDIDNWFELEVADSIPIFEKALVLANEGEEIYYYCWW